MKRIITYSLRKEERSSDNYYRTIADFSQRWIEAAQASIGAHVAGFRAYRKQSGQPERSFPECAFELLVLGVMLREHGLQARQTPPGILRWLEKLIDLQGRYAWAEKVIKTVRGWIVSLVLHAGNPKNNQETQGLEQTHLLLEWMQAVDYGGQVERLSEWQSYFETLSPQNVDEIITRCRSLAHDFAEDSQRILGAYTQGVTKFLQEEAPRHACQYDSLFVSRRPVEYHLGMLGTELLSRAYRQRFLETQRKVVILPPCMRAQPEGECKAISTPLGDHCMYCTPGCAIWAVTKLGEKQGFEVFMMPDELRKFRSGSPDGKNTFGVVGVSCALTNWSGGWDLDKEGIPGQGLLLNFVGCSYHWDKHGIPTEANLKKLIELIENKKT
jgi:hypothetical protein